MMKPLQKRRFYNDRGSAFLQALVAIAVVGMLLYWLSPRVIKQREQVTKTASIITARLAMHSMLDYTLLGIKQRWCFSEGWMPESCGTNTATILSHKRSVERILMKGDTVDFLKTMGVANAEKIPIDDFGATIQIQNFTSLHPVYRIIADLKSVKVAAIRVQVSRVTKGLVPEYGREVYLQVSVELLDDSGKPVKVGNSSLEAKSFVGVYPREVGSFALLVPGDLHLEQDAGFSGRDGDIYIPKVSSRDQYVSKNLGRIVFDSPVFVNGDLILAKDQADETADTTFTPVSFKEKVILGEGGIKRNGAPFKPNVTAGSEDLFWTNIREFGGFLKGVDVDGSRDLGLDVLAGKSLPGGGDVNLMQRCIQRTLAMTDLSKTADSKLYAQMLNQGGKRFDYRLAMDMMNRFTRQRGQVQEPTANNSRLLVENRSKIVGEKGAIATYRLEFGSLVVRGEIPDGGAAIIAPRIDLAPLENSLSSQTSKLRDSINDLNADISRLQNKVKDLAGDLSSVQDSLDKENGKGTKDTALIGNLTSRLAGLQGGLKNAKDSIEAKKADIDAAETKLSVTEKQLTVVRSNMNLQPTISLTMDSPDLGKGKKSNPSYKDLRVGFENGEVLVDSMGNPLPVKIFLQAYDVGFDRGNSLRRRGPAETNGWLTFTRNGTDFVTSGNIDDSKGVARVGMPADIGEINDDIDNVCANIGTSSSTAFGGVDWSTSFAASARHSWSFTNSYASRADYIFNAANASLAGGVTFVVKSTARNCIIEKDADFVSGFLTCDELTIKDRSTPLRIIGSIIVMKKLTIDPKAIEAGIRWSTIYQPMATFELRQAGVLTAQNGSSCNTINRFPVWHPIPSIVDVSNLYRCNAISLRSKADPFRWTSVDPDCGLVQNANATKCKNRMVNFFVLEVSRESGI